MADQKPSLNQPKPHAHDAGSAAAQDQSSEVAELKAKLERLETLLMLQIQNAPKTSPDTLWAKGHEKEMKIAAEMDRHAALFLETNKQRTQWEANKLNPDAKKLFKVSVGWCPEVIMRANDDTMAKAYYDKICGIRSISTNQGDPARTEYAIVEVTNDPVAQKAVASVWEYKPAEAA